VISLAQRQRLLAAALGLGLGLGWSAPAVQAAQNIVFVSGAFRRSIPVTDLEYLAETGRARGLLGDVMRLSRQDPKQLAGLLNQQMNLPVVLVSRLLNTRIGEAILDRIAEIVYPLNASKVGLQALRSAVVLGIADNKGSLSALSFLRAYPTQELAVSLPALMALMSKASSISELVRFFSDSPLDGLRGESVSTRSEGAAPAPTAGPTLEQTAPPKDAARIATP
jgi:hypothetical protein